MMQVSSRTAATVFAGAAALALVCAPRAGAQTAPGNPDAPAFGLVGIARGQSARLNVFVGNPNLQPGQIPPPCRVTLAFADEGGQLIRDRKGEVVMADGSVRSGESISLLLPAVQVARGAQRRLVRALVQGHPPDPGLPPDPCRGLISNLEVFDSLSGRTSVLYASTFGFQAPPEPDLPPPDADRPAAFAPVGLVRGQTAQLHVAIGNPNLIGNPDFIGNPNLIGNPDLAPSTVPPDVCRVTLGFVDESGAPFLDRAGSPVSTEGSLMPGQSLSLKLGSFDVFRTGEGRRREIRASVVAHPPDPGTPPDPCRNLVPTLELVGMTGRTSVLYAPGLVAPPEPDRPAGR